MELKDIEIKFRELLLPVFALDTIDEILPEHSLVDDLDAESLDFVEIMWIIEENFGVILSTSEILGDANGQDEVAFEENKLTSRGAALLKAQFPHNAEKVRSGLSKVEVFRLLTVRDFAQLIQKRLEKVGHPC